jgi:hypothetical protein
VVYLDERLRWNHFVAFGLVLAAVFFVFYEWRSAQCASWTYPLFASRSGAGKQNRKAGKRA